MDMYEYSTIPIDVTNIANKINALVDLTNMRKLGYKKIVDWLILNDIVEVQVFGDGKKRKTMTDYGKRMGFSIEDRLGRWGAYQAIVCDRHAEEFIITNIEDIVK